MNAFGEIVKYLREAKNISQNDLAEGICSVRHIRNIENGYKIPSVEVAIKLASKLDENIFLAFDESIIEHGFELYNELYMINTHFRNCNYKDVLNIINRIERHYDIEVLQSSNLRKQLLWLKTISMNKINGGNRNSKKLLLNILGLSSYHEIKEYLRNYCVQIDVHIINSLAVNELNSNNFPDSKIIFNELLSYYRRFKPRNDALYFDILYNFAKLHNKLKEYNHAIVYLNEAIETSKKRCIFKYLPKLHLERGYSNINLGFNQKAIQDYKYSLYLYKIFGQNEKIKNISNNFKEKYNIEFDDAIL